MFITHSNYFSAARLLAAVLSLCALTSQGQTTLEQGDLAFTGYSSNGDDGFSFVLLKDISAGTQILFTNNNWQGATLGTGENTVTWNAGALQAGTQVRVMICGMGCANASHGTVSINGSEFNLLTGGDHVFAYQTPNYILTAVILDGAALPTGLIINTNAVQPSGSNNRYFQGSATGSAQQIRATVNLGSSWVSWGGSGPLPSANNMHPIRPVITALSIPASTMIVGNTVTATLTVHDDRGNTHTLTTGTIGGFSLSTLSRVNSTTYTAQFAITNGGTDVSASNSIPVGNLMLTSAQSNPMTVAYSTAISQAGDLIDANRPAVSSIVRLSPASSSTNASTPLVFRVTFNEAVTGVDAADFTMTTLGITTGSASVSPVNSTTYDVSVPTVAGNGTLRLDVTSTSSISDAAGNSYDANFTSGETYTVDQTGPTVSSIAIASTLNGIGASNGTALSSVDYLVTFAESVTGVDVADFTLTSLGDASGSDAFPAANATVNSVSGSGASRTVTVNGIAGTGQLRLDFVSNGSVNDLAGNSSGAGFNTGNTYSIVLPEPTNHVTGLSATTLSTTSAQVSWTNAVGGQLPTHLLVAGRKIGTGSFPSITDGTYPAEDSSFPSFPNNSCVGIIDLIANPFQAAVTFTGLTTNAHYEFTVHTYTISPNNSLDNVNYKATSAPISATTVTALNLGGLNSVSNGIALSPLVANAAALPVFGFSMGSSGTQVVSSITIHTSSGVSGKLSGLSLVRSTDNDYSTTVDNTTLTGLTFTPSSTEVVITGLSGAVNTIKNYFLVANVTTVVSGATAALDFSITQSDFVVDLGFVGTASITGQHYLFSGSQQSDIIFSSGTSSNIVYGSFQAATGLTTANTASLATFQIRDGGGTTDADIQNTILSGLTLQISNAANVRRLGIFDGTTNVGEFDVTSDVVAITGLTLTATDNSTKLFSVRGTFKAEVTDNQFIQVAIIGASSANTGSGFASTDAGGPSTSGSVNKIVVTADRLLFVSPPATALLNQNFGMTVNAIDANNNKDEDHAGTVTLSKFSGSGTLIAGDAGGLSRSLTLGTATWTQLQINASGSCTLRAALSGLTNTDASITIVAPSAEPTTQASAVTFSNVTTSSVTVNFTAGNGTGRILIAKQATTVDSGPADGTSYIANNAFTSGSQLGTGNFVAGSGNGPITVTGLASGTLYFFQVYEFNGTGGSENYNVNTGTGNPNSVTTVAAPQITNINPSSGPEGTTVTITGFNFDAVPANNVVKFGTTTAVATLSSATSITTSVPVGATSGAISVTVAGITGTSSTSFNVTVAPVVPSITNFLPISGPVGTQVTITGTNFDIAAVNNLVKFNGTTAVVSASTATSITTSVPAGTTDGTLTVTVGGQTGTSTGSFTVTATPAPSISGFLPITGPVGTTVTITGTAFDPTPANNTVRFSNNITAVVTASTATSITTSVPAGASNGTLSVTVGGQVGTSTTSFTVTTAPVPSITNFQPTSGPVGTVVTITGTAFDATPANNTVKFFNDISAVVTTSSATSIVTSVPAGATDGTLTVTVGGLTGTSTSIFTVTVPPPAPSISSLNPQKGTIGTPVVIAGSNFDVVPGNNIVKFTGTTTTVTPSGGTTGSLNVQVPAGATTGPVTVTAAGQISNGMNFIVDTTAPTIVNATASSGTRTLSATITDGETLVTGATVEFRAIAIGGTFTTAAMTGAGNAWAYTVPTEFDMGELGLEFRFKATNEVGLTSSFTSLFGLRVDAPATSVLTTIPFDGFGTTTAQYRIFSIPLELDNDAFGVIFDELGEADKKKWRAAHYANGDLTYLATSTHIVPGKGYWMLIKDEIALKAGAGKTVQANSDSHFTINLVNGWNQIGNPYAFDVPWADIQSANPGIGALNTWSGEWSDTATKLEKYKGGFVMVTGALPLKIPVIKKPGRSSAPAPMQNAIDQPDWEVKFSVKQGDMQYKIGGVGMRAEASDGFDRYDNFTLPHMDDFLELNHTRTLGRTPYTRDIVPTSDYHAWEFSINSSLPGEPVQLSWDNSYFGQGEKVLVLYDVRKDIMIEMGRASRYGFDFTHDNKFKVFYGSTEAVLGEILNDKPRLLSVSPNPSDGDFAVDYAVPYGTASHIDISIVDMTGRSHGTIVNGSHDGGIHTAKWNALANDPLATGLYIIQFKTGKGSSSHRLIIK